jgi:hypothetical protein
MMEERIYLSRRNLLALLSKLDRAAAGDATAKTIIKYRNPKDPFVQTMDAIAVTAVEDKDYYVDRTPGVMHPADEPDVGTRDAPPPAEVTINLAEFRSRIFVGFKAGQEVRLHFKLDDLDADPSIVVNVVIPDTTYSISDSFFQGMFEQSLLQYGKCFNEKYKFVMKEEFHHTLNRMFRNLAYQELNLPNATADSA